MHVEVELELVVQPRVDRLGGRPEGQDVLGGVLVEGGLLSGAEGVGDLDHSHEGPHWWDEVVELASKVLEGFEHRYVINKAAGGSVNSDICVFAT